VGGTHQLLLTITHAVAAGEVSGDEDDPYDDAGDLGHGDHHDTDTEYASESAGDGNAGGTVAPEVQPTCLPWMFHVCTIMPSHSGSHIQQCG
jgi:hypothetical protein